MVCICMVARGRRREIGPVDYLLRHRPSGLSIKRPVLRSIAISCVQEPRLGTSPIRGYSCVKMIRECQSVLPSQIAVIAFREKRI